MKQLSLSVTLLLISLTIAHPVIAQEPTTGRPEFGSLQITDFDAVNRDNLNVNFTIPIVSKPGRGLQFSHEVVYDSLIWLPVDGNWTPVADGEGNPTFGWKTGTVVGDIKWSEIREFCYDEFGFPSGSIIDRDAYIYTDATGTTHPFDVTVHLETGTCGSTVSGNLTGYALDNSGLFLNASDPVNPFVTFSEGMVSEVSASGVILDRNGNRIRRVVSGNLTQWIDTLGQIALKIVREPGYIDFQYQDRNGDYSSLTTIRLNYQNFNVRTKFGCPGIQEFNAVVSLPVSADLPDGTSYQFSYEDTPSASGFTTARLSEVILPRGGRHEYEYSGPNGGINCVDGSVTGLIRGVDDGTQAATWDFSRTLLAEQPERWKTTEIPAQLPYDLEPNHSVYEFLDHRETLSTTYQGTEGAGVVLETVSRSYDADGLPASATVTLDDGTQSRVETDYDSFSNLLERREFAFGAGQPGPVERTTVFTFVNSQVYNSRNMRDLVESIDIYDGSKQTGVLRSKVEVAYDDYSATEFTCITDAPQHDSRFDCAYLYRGNPTSITRYADVSDELNPTSPLTWTLHHDTVGNIRRFDLQNVLQKRFGFTIATAYAFQESTQIGPDLGTPLTSQATYNLNLGQVASTNDANGQPATFAYDLQNRLTTIIRPDGIDLSITYDDATGSITTSRAIQGFDRREEIRLVDPLGRTSRVTIQDNATPPTIFSMVDQQYDPLGRSYRLSNPHAGTPTYWSEVRFDALGRTVLAFGPDGSPAANNTTWDYAGQGVTITDQAGNQVRLGLDSLGRLDKVFERHSVSGSLTEETSYSYNALDRLETVAQGPQVRSASYDGLGNQLSSHSVEADGPAASVYDTLGRLLSSIDARGVSTDYVYDALNRVIGIGSDVGSSGGAGASSVVLLYGTDPGANNNGRLISRSDGAGSESYQYDVLGRITQVDKVIDSVTYTIGYSYNLADQVTSITYPSGRVVTTSHGTIGDAVGLSGYISNVTRNVARQITSYDVDNGVHASLNFDPQTLQLSGLAYSSGSSALFDVSYGYDLGSGNNGQIRRIIDNKKSGRTLTLGYDFLGRLSNAQTQGESGGGCSGGELNTAVGSGSGTVRDIMKTNRGGSGGCPQVIPDFPKWHLTWKIDRHGNIEAQDVLVAQDRDDYPDTPEYTVDIDPVTNRIADLGFDYDGNGNLESDGSFVAEFDANNDIVDMLVGMTTATYTYDAGGLRVKKELGLSATVYVWADGKVIAEYVDGSLDKEFVYFEDELIATHLGDQTLDFHHNDHLSVRAITNANGVLVTELGHYPFGEIWYQRWTGRTARSFAGYERDSESGLDSAGRRFYASRLGRFLSPSAANPLLEDPQSLNGFSYVRNDPSNRVSPMGVRQEPAGTLVHRSSRAGDLLFEVEPVSIDLPSRGNMSLNPPAFNARNFYRYRGHDLRKSPYDFLKAKNFVVGWAREVCRYGTSNVGPTRDCRTDGTVTALGDERWNPDGKSPYPGTGGFWSTLYGRASGVAGGCTLLEGVEICGLGVGGGGGPLSAIAAKLALRF